LIGSNDIFLNKCGLLVMVESLVNSSVWPSAGACAASALPIVVSAPGLF